MAKKRSIYNTLLKTKSVNGSQQSKNALEWFQKHVKRMNINHAKLAKDPKNTQVERWTIGKLYTFNYDPKHKDKLPYYDAFPMTMVVGPAKGGFYGINFHYLPLKLRAELFDALMEISDNDRLDDMTKIKLSYSILAGTQKMRAFAPCFKHYLTSQLGSRLTMIPATEWKIAIFLPTQQFVGANAKKVWADSRAMI